MGNNNPIEYNLRVIFYGNIPVEISNRINNNHNNITHVINEYDYYIYKLNKLYYWYIYLTPINSDINTIENYLVRHPFEKNNSPSKKNVVLCFVNLTEAMNLLQDYQIKFSKGIKKEERIPYFVFNQQNLGINNRPLWKITIEYIEVYDKISISVVNEKLQIYQTDFTYDDFSKCRIFRNFNDLEEIYIKLNELKNRNRYRLKINPNTEKLEMIFNINPQENEDDQGNYNYFDKESEDEIDDECNNIKSIKTKKPTKLKERTYQRVFGNNYDAQLIIEQNVFIHVLLTDLLENERSIINVLFDATNYFYYLPLKIDPNKVCYTSFNMMLVGKTGSGKSLLMNKIAGKNITHSCEGSLRTKDIFMQEICNGKINMYDTCGPGGEFETEKIYSNIEEKLRLLNKNGEKIDLLLIVIKNNEQLDDKVLEEFFIKLIQKNIEYLIVINCERRIEDAIQMKSILVERFMEFSCQIDESKMLVMNIKKDITPLFRKIFETFRSNRITINNLEVNHLYRISNLSNYSQINNLLLYKNITYEMIFKRKNWEAQKYFIIYLLTTIGTELIPIGNLVLPQIINLKFLSHLYRIYFGVPLFSQTFLNNPRLRHIRNRTLIRNISSFLTKLGLRSVAIIIIKSGEKIAIKATFDFLILIPGLGYILDVIIGNSIDIPSLTISYRRAKEEFLKILMNNPNDCVKRIIQNYNDAINFFGRRANIRINNDYFNIPNINNMPIIDNNLEELLLNDEEEENNNV